MYDDGEVSGDATVLLFHLVRCEQWHGGECHWPLSPHNPVKEALYEGACVLGSSTLSGLTDDDGKTLLFRYVAMHSARSCQRRNVMVARAGRWRVGRGAAPSFCWNNSGWM